MTHNLLQNPTFAEHDSALAARRNMGQFCQSWFVEYGAPAPVDLGPARLLPNPDGVRIHIRSAKSWVRLWQTIELPGVESARQGTVKVRAKSSGKTGASLNLEWVSLLKINPQGKRVFAKKLLTQRRPITEQVEEYEARIALSDLASGTPYIFAIQFSEGPGEIELESVEFSCQNFPAGLNVPVKYINKENNQDSERDNHLTVINEFTPKTERLINLKDRSRSFLGAVIGLEGNKLVGWANLPDNNSEVLVFVDGRMVGSALPNGINADLAGGIDQLAKYGFAVEIPNALLDGSEHQVSIRSSAGGRSAQGSEQIRFLDLHSSSKQANLASIIQEPIHTPLRDPLPTIKGAILENTPPVDVRRVAVVSWDMAHNPVGRAFLIADMAARNCVVELVGPMFPMYGTTIWPPIETAKMAIHAFPASTFKDFVAGAREIASRVKCDIVHVGKARFSSLFIGALIKQANGCPIVVDVDDHELSFFNDQRTASLDDLVAAISEDPQILDKPYTEIFTRYAEGLIAECDGITVSNYSLQKRFGGIVVRHGRDERVFNPDLYDRKAIRAEFGYTDKDRVILFLGTPRSHKGVFDIADALEELNDERLALCIIGSITDKRISVRFSKYKNARVDLHHDQSWERLPELVSMADAVFILQDSSSPISEYQIPAKLTDAMALGVPVYATPVPPLSDLIAAGAIIPVFNAADLRDELRKISADATDVGHKLRVRDYYLTELSYAINSARLGLAFDRAVTSSRKSVPAFDSLFAAIQHISGEKMPRFAPLSSPAIGKNIKPDLVFLWKQNDSDIYGRRSDMMAKYLLKSGAINRVLHFDAAISSVDLDKQAKHGADATAHQGNLVYINTVRRILRQADTPGLLRRTFLYRSEKAAMRYLGTDLPPREAYSDFVKGELRDANISQSPVLWVCPVVFDFAMFKSVVQPGYIIADLIDDQRRFPGRETHRLRVAQAYDEVLSEANLAIANCESLRHGFATSRNDIKVIPNGAETFDLKEFRAVPEDISHLPRPILGYVGNLRDRVDLDLIGKVADAFPDGSVVLIGSAHDRPDVIELGRRPNVHVLGVKPYSEVADYIRTFNVALVPHLRNELSDSMNPLKLYVYFALNVPIVTTDVANIGDISPHAIIASDHQSFIRAISRILGGSEVLPSQLQRDTVLKKVSWEARVDSVIDLIESDMSGY
ncbi:glycosyltransferase family 4 protein [Sphingomonas sp. Leaf38]|uniref:glycosyltransferase family 4 protein n=1 Tax=Sphingomonas sp. Leaf38 TaxID=1736217 RepID=UPI0009E68E9B|nr:glycosyltransferase [Sphingomonas sp. Leaf38]